MEAYSWPRKYRYIASLSATVLFGSTKRRVLAMRHWGYFPAGTRVTYPSGGFTHGLELPNTVDVAELHHRVSELGIGFSISRQRVAIERCCM